MVHAACACHAGGTACVCTWSAGAVLRLACSWHADGPDMACTWHAHGVQLACTWHAPGMHMACMHMAWTWHAPGMHMVLQAQLAAKEDWQAPVEHRHAKAEAEAAEAAEAAAAAWQRGAGARELAAARRRRVAHDARRLEECELLGYRRRITHPGGWLRLTELRRAVAGRRLCRRRFSAALLDLARRRVAEDVSLEDAMGQLIIRLRTFFERASLKHEQLEHSLIPRLPCPSSTSLVLPTAAATVPSAPASSISVATRDT